VITLAIAEMTAKLFTLASNSTLRTNHIGTLTPISQMVGHSSKPNFRATSARTLDHTAAVGTLCAPEQLLLLVVTFGQIRAAECPSYALHHQNIFLMRHFLVICKAKMAPTRATTPSKESERVNA
jgi:hypothetical protein